MELLQEYGASSSEEEEVKAQAQANVVDTTVCAMEKKEEITRHFAQKMRGLTHWMTAEERAFEFRGYTAKRRRKLNQPDKQPSPSSPSPALYEEAVSDTLLPLFPSISANEKMIEVMDQAANDMTRPVVRRCLIGHTGAVYCARWNPVFPSLLLSASMDSTLRIWSDSDPSTSSSSSSSSPCRRVLKHHQMGVKSSQWSLDGKFVLSGAFDGVTAYTDAETAQVVAQFTATRFHGNNHSSRVTSVCVHPTDPHFFLIGSDRGTITSHDLRIKPTTPVQIYQKSFGEIYDLLFLPSHDQDNHRFVSSAAIQRQSSSHQTLLVWDFRSSALLYDQLDRDLVAFTCLRLHPSERWFVAQSTANYAIQFSATSPYKKLKPSTKRRKAKSFQARFDGGHEVAGYSIQCSFNADGSFLATGDANGRVVYYQTMLNNHQGNSITSLQLYAPQTPCVCAEFHPYKYSTLAAGSSDGKLALLYYN